MTLVLAKQVSVVYSFISSLQDCSLKTREEFGLQMEFYLMEKLQTQQNCHLEPGDSHRNL